MPIPAEIAATFPSDTRDRGQQYYRRGVVRIMSVDERGIMANVRGSEVYQVLLTQDENERFAHSSECPETVPVNTLGANASISYGILW